MTSFMLIKVFISLSKLSSMGVLEEEDRQGGGGATGFLLEEEEEGGNRLPV